MRLLAVQRAFVRRARALDRDLPAAVEDDVEALHHARVASRRLREILPLVGPAGGHRGDGELRAVRRRVRRLTRALGGVRELDVALGILDALRQTHPDLAEAIGAARLAVEADRRRRREEMARHLDDLDARDLAGDLTELAQHVGQGSPVEHAMRLRHRLERRVDRLDAAIDEAGALYAFDRLHLVRIAVKQVRYVLELVHEFGRVRTLRLVNRLTQSQDLLGRLHDLEVAAGYIRRQGGAHEDARASENERVQRLVERETRELHAAYLGRVDKLIDVIASCRGEIDLKLAVGPMPRRRAERSGHGR